MYELNEWVLFFLTIALFYICVEFGFRLGKRKSAALDPDARTHVGTIEGALLGLLSLLLGFAFSMAMGRYDSRRDIVIAEANDLQTTYLRSKLLASPYRDQVAELLTKYVDSRIDYLRAGRDEIVIQKAVAWTLALQKELWSTAVAAAQQDSDEVRTGYFVESLNGLIDDHTRRMNAMESHVPDIILLLLIFVGAMTLAMTGYSSGLTGTRLLLPRSILIVLVAATLLVIMDLDRPRRGFITVSERAMQELQEAMHKDARR